MSRHITAPEETVRLRTGNLRGDTYAGWDQCPNCGGAVDLSEVQPMSTVVCPHCARTFDALNDFGPFTLQEVIGQGSIGVVYRAVDNHLDRPIALKLLRDSVNRSRGTPEDLEMEAAAMASMSVPGVVRVYSTGTENGHFYIAMEVLPGGSLQQRINEEGRISEQHALAVGLQVARGLQSVNWSGMLHRDVKPANILYAADGTVKIADFGLAIPWKKVAETASDEIVGTPHYLAPERIRGDKEDFRSDIYSLGATLYHALTGRPPFEAATPILVAVKRLKSSPVSIQTFVPHISKPTALCLDRMMATNPEKRFQSYDELIESLQYALDQKKAHAAKPKLVKYRAVVTKRSTEDQRFWSWVTVISLVIMIALAVIFWSGRIGKLVSYVPPHRTGVDPASTARPPGSQAGTLGPQVDPRVGREVSPALALDAELAVLLSGDAEKAADLYYAAWRQDGAETKQAWAALFGGISELSAGDLHQARKMFRHLTEVSVPAQTAEETELAEFFKHVGQLFGSDTLPAVDALSPADRPPETLLLLIGGLAYLADPSAEVDDGVKMLREFRSAPRSEAYAWFSKLEVLSTNHIEKAVQYEASLKVLHSDAGSGEKADARAHIDKLGPSYAARAENSVP